MKRVRRAALAAALLPLASVAVAPAAAQSAMCASGGVCGFGFVWSDTDNNGIQDAGEPGIAGAVVTLDADLGVTATDTEGFYYFSIGAGAYAIAVQIPPGTRPSPADLGGDDGLDSDGVADGIGNSVATMTLSEIAGARIDFGFFASPVVQPGTARRDTGRTTRKRGRSAASPLAGSPTHGIRRSDGSKRSARTRPSPCSARWCRPN